MTKKTLGDRIDGKGFSKEPLSDEELAEGRQRNSILDREFVSLDSLVDALPPSVVAKLAKRLNIGLWHSLVQIVTQYKGSIAGGLAVGAYFGFDEITSFVKLLLGIGP